MSVLLETDATPFVRIDFSDDATWQSVLEQASRPTEEGFLANLAVIEDSALGKRSLSKLPGKLERTQP